MNPHMKDIWDSDQGMLTEKDRKAIFNRIHSMLFWLGKFIPDDERLDGERVNLRDTIYHFITAENPTAEETEDALQMADIMEKKARRLEEEVRIRPDLTKGQAHMLLDEICGLLRGVDEIRHAKGATAELKTKVLMSKVADEKRWREFVKVAT
jgi:hypothetical protein